MSNILVGHYLPLNSPVHNLEARIKIISLFAVLAAIITVRSLAGYTLLTVFIVSVIFLSKIGIKTALQGIRQVGSFLLVIFFMNALFFNGENLLWSYSIFHISAGGIVQGVNVVLKVEYMMILSSVLLATTTPMEITSAIERIMSPLQFIRIPVNDLAMMISIAIQFVPVLTEESELIIKAQMARGAKLDSPKLRDKAVAAIPLIIPIFICAFRRADELSLAMEARGYRGGNNRTKRRRVPLHVFDITALLVSITFCAVEIFCL
jgi:energy-coupling factor transport system permease protein